MRWEPSRRGPSMYFKSPPVVMAQFVISFCRLGSPASSNKSRLSYCKTLQHRTLTLTFCTVSHSVAYSCMLLHQHPVGKAAKKLIHAHGHYHHRADFPPPHHPPLDKLPPPHTEAIGKDEVDLSLFPDIQILVPFSLFCFLAKCGWKKGSVALQIEQGSEKL